VWLIRETLKTRLRNWNAGFLLGVALGRGCLTGSLQECTVGRVELWVFMMNVPA
jgi:hypothetical protein